MADFAAIVYETEPTGPWLGSTGLLIFLSTWSLVVTGEW